MRLVHFFLARKKGITAIAALLTFMFALGCFSFDGIASLKASTAHLRQKFADNQLPNGGGEDVDRGQAVAANVNLWRNLLQNTGNADAAEQSTRFNQPADNAKRGTAAEQTYYQPYADLRQELGGVTVFSNGYNMWVQSQEAPLQMTP